MAIIQRGADSKDQKGKWDSGDQRQRNMRQEVGIGCLTQHIRILTPIDCTRKYIDICSCSETNLAWAVLGTWPTRVNIIPFRCLPISTYWWRTCIPCVTCARWNWFCWIASLSKLFSHLYVETLLLQITVWKQTSRRGQEGNASRLFHVECLARLGPLLVADPSHDWRNTLFPDYHKYW